jgi:integrase
MIYKRGKFYWYEFEFNGKRYRESTKIIVGKGVPGEPTPKEKAKQIETAKRQELALAAVGIEPPAPVEPEPEKPTLSAWAAHWLLTYAKVHCKFATHRLYSQCFEDHLEPRLGKSRLDEISRADIRGLIAAKIDEGLSKGTVRNIMAPLRGMLTHAVEEGLIPSNPASKLGRFSKETSAKANSKKIVPYTASEVQALLSAAQSKSAQLYAFLLTAILTGMRLGELLGLQWGELDLHNKCIHVKRAVSRRRIETPKNHLQRRIDLADELARVLEELHKGRKEEWFAKGKSVPEWVFCNEEGTFVNEFNLRTRKFYPLLKKAGLRKVRIHDLRHSYASLMLEQGESLAYIRDQMGHHSIQVTVDLYGHLVPGGNRAAVDRLGAHILPAAVAATAVHA